MGYLRYLPVLLILRTTAATHLPPPDCSPPVPSPPPCPPCAPAPAPDSPVYRVALDHYGPEPSVLPPIKVPHVITPPHHEPLKVLPHPPIPAPKLISHRIVHYKTYIKPQVYQRIITVPKVFRFLKKGVHPVVEHIPYQAKPILPEMEQPSSGLGSDCLKTPVPVPVPKLDLPNLPPPCGCPNFVC